jgi:hypothetical protein
MAPFSKFAVAGYGAGTLALAANLGGWGGIFEQHELLPFVAFPSGATQTFFSFMTWRGLSPTGSFGCCHLPAGWSGAGHRDRAWYAKRAPRWRWGLPTLSSARSAGN